MNDCTNHDKKECGCTPGVVCPCCKGTFWLHEDLAPGYGTHKCLYCRMHCNVIYEHTEGKWYE